jgi:hypothetical protein
MTRKSLVRTLGVMSLAAWVSVMSAAASDGLPSLSVPGNNVGTTIVDHSPDGGVDPIRSMPAPAGVNAVRPSVTSVLQARSHMPAGAPVPPTEELQLLDPNVDPLGRPVAKVSQTVGPDGTVKVDIPPAVLVHRYYYTGDRSFQGPLLPGGPTIVVFNHPDNGERIYLEIQMPPGAPRVIYTRHAIEYNYGVQSLILTFGHHGRPKVTFRQGVSAGLAAKVAREQTRQTVSRFIARTGAPEARRKAGQTLRNVAGSTADRIHDVAKAAVAPIIQIAKMIPGVQMLTSPPEQSIENERDALIQRGTAELTSLQGSIPTVR